ncbi:Nucleoporin Nup133/Nup155-like C-terminal domain-containing protein [[Candida] zeylanoides]
MDQRLVFRPRRGLTDSGDTSSAGAASTTVPTATEPHTATTAAPSGSSTAAIELTKNNSFCISRLPASPPVLTSPQGLLNGYTDHFSQYALVVTDRSINVWSYNSTDATPLSIEFPVQKNTSLPPLAILTRPTTYHAEDPGIIIIDSTSGHVKFYQSVQHAPALGLINNRSLELTIPLDSASGEYITLAENLEPAGIVVATSLCRTVLLGLRDYVGKPSLTLTELTSAAGGGPAAAATGLLAKWFRHQRDSGNEVVSVKTVKVQDSGMSQEIMVQTRDGCFELVHLSLVTPVGKGAIVDRKRGYRQHLAAAIENNTEEILPGSPSPVTVLDSWPLPNDRFLVLCEIEPNPFAPRTGDVASDYLLVSLQIDATGVLHLGTHRLSQAHGRLFANTDSASKPQLFLPQPGHTAFVMVGNSIVLADVNPAYTRRADEVVRLKSSVQIVGQGYEDGLLDSNEAIILLTSNAGVLRIEKYANGDDVEMVEASTSSSSIKSQIEQGVFFAHSDEINFDLANGADEIEDFEAACIQVANDIVDSSSPYLPQFLPSVGDFLHVKIGLLQELIGYVCRNTDRKQQIIIPQVVERLQKVSVGWQLWATVEGSGQPQALLTKAVLPYVPKDTTDAVRFFLNKEIVNINAVLNDFVIELVQNNVSLTFVDQLLVNTLYKGVFLNEEEHIEPGMMPRKLWIFETDLIVQFEQVFRKLYCEQGADMVTVADKQHNYQLCQVLYYFVTSAIQYMQQHDVTNGQQLREYLRWYSASKYHWIESLLSRGLVHEAIDICEKYRDLSSLVRVLERERVNGYIEPKAFEEYFEKFGFDFAASLYTYYLDEDRIDQLLLGFENYRTYLARFFKENPQRTSEVSWIRNFLDGNFVQGATTLLRESHDDNVAHKELKFTLAKLAAAASVASGHSSDNLSTELQTEANNNLVVIRIQNKLFEELARPVANEAPLLTFEYVVKHFKNDRVTRPEFERMASDAVEQLSQRQSLSATNLIELLTLTKPTLNSGNNFAHALRVASLIPNESQSRQQCQLVWLRVLTLGDDWAALTETVHESDAAIKLRISNSALARTLGLVNRELVQELENLLRQPTAAQAAIDAHPTLGMDDALSTRLLVQLKGLVEHHQLATWVESIKSEVT